MKEDMKLSCHFISQPNKLIQIIRNIYHKYILFSHVNLLCFRIRFTLPLNFQDKHFSVNRLDLLTSNFLQTEINKYLLNREMFILMK